MSETDDKRSRGERFKAIDQRRCRIGAPVKVLTREAKLSTRAYELWLNGEFVPSWRSISRLSAAIAELEREALGQ